MKYPSKIAMVNPVACNAYQMAFIKERVHSRSFKLAMDGVPFNIAVFGDMTQSSAREAYHLAGIRLKAIAGELPQGLLHLKVDQVPVLIQPILYFTKEVDPAKIPWMDALCLFGAAAYEEEKVKPEKKLGYMLPNGSRVEISLEIDRARRWGIRNPDRGRGVSGRWRSFPLGSLKETVL